MVTCMQVIEIKQISFTINIVSLSPIYLSHENILPVHARSWKSLCHYKDQRWRQMIQ